MGINRDTHEGKNGVWYREWAPGAKVGRGGEAGSRTDAHTVTHTVTRTVTRTVSHTCLCLIGKLGTHLLICTRAHIHTTHTQPRISSTYTHTCTPIMCM